MCFAVFHKHKQQQYSDILYKTKRHREISLKHKNINVIQRKQSSQQQG